MAKSNIAFPSDLAEPIDSSRLVTRLHRPSLDDLRAQTASPSISLMGVYVRSRATSPMSSQECVNTIVHPADDDTELDSVPSFSRINWNPHLATSFASFAAESAGAPTGPCVAPAQMRPKAVEARAGWEYRETPGPPPGYTLESDDDDEEVLYMQDERSVRAELTQLIAQLNQQYSHSSHASSSSVSTHITSTTESPRTSQISSRDTDSPHTSVRFAPTDTVFHTHAVRRTRRILDFKKAAKNERAATDTDTDADTATVALARSPRYRANFFEDVEDDDDDDEALPSDAPLPKQKKGFSVFKVIKKLTFGTASHRKAASADAISMQTITAPSKPTPKEKVKSSSASMFSLRSTAHPPSIKSLHPSLASTATKKRVLVKKNKGKATQATQHSPTDTALLTSSSRAIEHKYLRRRSALFSGYADVVQPVEWRLPADLDSEEVAEAMKVVSNLQSMDDWLYKR